MAGRHNRKDKITLVVICAHSLLSLSVCLSLSPSQAYQRLLYKSPSSVTSSAPPPQKKKQNKTKQNKTNKKKQNKQTKQKKNNNKNLKKKCIQFLMKKRNIHMFKIKLAPPCKKKKKKKKKTLIKWKKNC